MKNLATLVTLGMLGLTSACSKESNQYVGCQINNAPVIIYQSQPPFYERDSPVKESYIPIQETKKENEKLGLVSNDTKRGLVLIESGNELKLGEHLESLVLYRSHVSSPNVIYKAGNERYYAETRESWYAIDGKTGQVLTDSQDLEKLENKFRWDGIWSEIDSGLEKKEGKVFIKNWESLKGCYSKKNWESLVWSDI